MRTTRHAGHLAGYAAQGVVKHQHGALAANSRNELESDSSRTRRPARSQRRLLPRSSRPACSTYRRLAQGDRPYDSLTDLPGRSRRPASGGRRSARDRFAVSSSPTRATRVGIMLVSSIMAKPSFQPGAPRPALDPGAGHAVRARGDDGSFPSSSTARRSARSTSAGWATPRLPSSERIRADTAVRRPGVDPAQNAETHGASGGADLDALTGLRNHGSFQREVGESVASAAGASRSRFSCSISTGQGFQRSFGHPAGDAFLGGVAVAMAHATREGTGSTLRRDESSRSSPERTGRLPTRSPCASGTASPTCRPRPADRMSRSASGRLLPRRTVDEGRALEMADRAHLSRRPGGDRRAGRESPADPYLRALDETALALLAGMTRRSCSRRSWRAPRRCWDTQATSISPKPDGETLVVSHCSGLFEGWVGIACRSPKGSVARSSDGRTLSVRRLRRVCRPFAESAKGAYGSVLGVHSSRAGRLGVTGLRRDARSGVRDTRDARAGAVRPARSIALDNSRLVRRGRSEARCTTRRPGLPTASC